MDELAASINRDPLKFRMMHLDPNGRPGGFARDAANASAGWIAMRRRAKPSASASPAAKGIVRGGVRGSGDRSGEEDLRVRHVAQTFECGASPTHQTSSSRSRRLIAGIGPALREGMEFEQGRSSTRRSGNMKCRGFKDVPTLDIKLLDRRTCHPPGAGETPIVAIAPAIASGLLRRTAAARYAAQAHITLETSMHRIILATLLFTASFALAAEPSPYQDRAVGGHRRRPVEKLPAAWGVGGYSRRRQRSSRRGSVYPEAKR